MDVEFLRYQFEDGYYGVITKNGLKIGVRHIQMLYMLASSVTLGFIRGSLGVAVLAVNDQSRKDDTYIQIHNWNPKIQGAVLSSFFFGYALMLLPSELYMRRIGGKLLMTGVLLVNGALCVAMPTIINKGGWIAACNANLFLGMSHACFFTINQSLFEYWLPPNEKKFFNCLVYGGVQLGIIIGLPVSGLLSSAPLGWELVYYCMAMAGLSMAVISGALTASSPDEHQAVGDAEKEFIKETLSCYRKKEIEKPWRYILRSPQFWVLTSVHACSNAVFIFFLVYVPAHLMVLGVPLKDSAWYAMLPIVSMSVMYTLLSPICDWIYSIRIFSYLFSATLFRKIINAFGSFGVVMGLATLLNLPTDWSGPALIVLVGVLTSLGFQFCGFLSSYKDMSENFSGSLMLISCTVSSIVGAAVPFVVGFLINADMFEFQYWRVILMTLASLYTVSTVFYTAFGSHERQYWDHLNSSYKRRLKHLNGEIHHVQMEDYGHTNLALRGCDLIDTAL